MRSSRTGATLFAYALAIAILSVAGIFIISQTNKKNAIGAHRKPPVFVDIGTLTVNLQEERGDHMFQLQCTAQLPDTKQEALFRQYMPEVKNRLILLASAKQPSDISSNAGRKQLQDEILSGLRKPLESSGQSLDVEAIHFTSFVIE